MDSESERVVFHVSTKESNEALQVRGAHCVEQRGRHVRDGRREQERGRAHGEVAQVVPPRERVERQRCACDLPRREREERGVCAAERGQRRAVFGEGVQRGEDVGCGRVELGAGQLVQRVQDHVEHCRVLGDGDEGVYPGRRRCC